MVPAEAPANGTNSAEGAHGIGPGTLHGLEAASSCQFGINCYRGRQSPTRGTWIPFYLERVR